MRDAVGERVRLSRAGPGDHEERGAGYACLLPDAMLDGSSLFGIELVEIGDGHGLRIVQGVVVREKHVSLLFATRPRTCRQIAERSAPPPERRGKTTGARASQALLWRG